MSKRMAVIAIICASLAVGVTVLTSKLHRYTTYDMQLQCSACADSMRKEGLPFTYRQGVVNQRIDREISGMALTNPTFSRLAAATDGFFWFTVFYLISLCIFEFRKHNRQPTSKV